MRPAVGGDDACSDSVHGVKDEAVGDSLVPRMGVTKGSLSSERETSRRVFSGRGNVGVSRDTCAMLSGRESVSTVSSGTVVVRLPSGPTLMGSFKPGEGLSEHGINAWTRG